MLQDILVYMIIGGVLLRTLFALVRFFRSPGSGAKACKGCAVCSIEKSQMTIN